MTTETIERTPAEQRKAKALAHVQSLSTELDRLQNRKKTAAEDATRLDDEIAKAERAGSDPKTLSALRRDHTEQQSVAGDLERVISNMESELVPARAQLEDAAKACKAEKYNAIVEQQRALAAVIDEAVHTIVETMKVKEGLAKKQDWSQSDIGCPQPSLAPDGIRVKLREAMTPWLNGAEMKGKLAPFGEQDWSCRLMHPAGHLEPYNQQ